MTRPDDLLPTGPLVGFEDIIDGYFPLSVSLAQMMDRLSVDCTLVDLSHAPIMHIPGLSPDAPVPLNIRAGQAGLILHSLLHVDRRTGPLVVSGLGGWTWFDAECSDQKLDPMTRLAEPAFVRGVGNGVLAAHATTFNAPDPWFEALRYLGRKTSERTQALLREAISRGIIQSSENQGRMISKPSASVGGTKCAEKR